MHCCEFCHIQFTPRNQVKNPRACVTEKCQKLRQRDNEKTWKQKHLDQYDKEYHEIQRDKRDKEIEDILNSILKCIEVGINFLGQKIEFQNFKVYFTTFIFKLGIRQINKFWNSKEPFNINNVKEQIT
jgi:hypothetical protein